MPDTNTNSRPQLSFTWKSPQGKEIFDSASNAWAQTQPEGKKSQQDFILWLLTKADRHDSTDNLRKRLDALGLTSLVEAYLNRKAADEHMLQVIADMLENAKEKAESEVRIEITALKKTADSLQSLTNRQAEEIIALKTDIADLTADNEMAESQLETRTNELNELQEKFGNLSDKAEAIQKTKNELELAAAALREELNAAKSDIITHRETNLKLEEELTTLKTNIAAQELEIKKLSGLKQEAEKQLEQATAGKSEAEEKARKLEDERGAMREEIASLKATIAGSEKTITALENVISAFGKTSSADNKKK